MRDYDVKPTPDPFVGKTVRDSDQSRPAPVIERKREWEHGSEGMGNNCPRVGKPVHTDPNKTPDPCRGGYYPCNNTDWKSKGIVRRIKGTGQIVEREK